MTARAGFRDRWVIEVIRADYIGDSCRVLLLVLARSMTDKGIVSVPRQQLADALGKHERRISERVSEAVDAGLLDRSAGGYRGRTAEYMAYLPAEKGAAGAHPFHGKGAGERVPKSAPFSAEKTVRKGATQRVPNAGARGRVSLEPRQNQPNTDDSRGELNHGENPRRSDKRISTDSRLAAVFPITQSTEQDLAS